MAEKPGGSSFVPAAESFSPEKAWKVVPEILDTVERTNKLLQEARGTGGVTQIDYKNLVVKSPIQEQDIQKIQLQSAELLMKEYQQDSVTALINRIERCTH